MFQKSKQPDNPAWFTLAEMHRAFDVSPQAFSKSVRPLLAEADVRNDGKRGVKVRCRGAIDAWAQRKADQAAETAAKKADPLLVGADSPALEEYRRHRANLARMDVEERQKSHADIGQLNEALTRFASSIRRAGEVLQRRFGPDALDILNDALDQAEREWGGIEVITTAPTIITTPKVESSAVRQAMQRVAQASRVRRCRSMLQFSEQEIVLPTGPFMGERFKRDRQPWAALWLDAVGSGNWRRHNLTGPSQAGKTLAGSTIPVVYHLFEHSETTIYAAPTLEMAADKWQQDVLPVIEASAYRDLLPERGGASKGGAATSIQFRHGPTLKFMTGGGGDKVRAGFTSRVAVITETDGMDEAGESSRETDKISQIETRTNAFGDRARVYLECTTSTDTGRTWQELKQGTDSRLALPCPHCGKFGTPEREHLNGWQDAASATDAGQRATLVCPSCGIVWSEADRIGANRLAKMIHKGQAVDDAGTIIGMIPATHTLSLRFTAVNNSFTTMALVAEEEWAAQRQGDAALNEKKLRQFRWALPSEAESVTLTELDAQAITRRAIDVPRGRTPADVLRLTVGIDIGKWLAHWVCVGWKGDGTPHVIEYGRLEVPSASMAEESAIISALRRFRDEVCAPGWPSVTADAPNARPSLVLVDSGNWESTVVAFTKESGGLFLPAKGFGTQQVGRRKSMHDPGYELVAQPAGHSLVEINADLWKSYVHARLQTPAGQPGGLTIFHATPTEHLSFTKHMTAEKRVEEFIAGRGLVTRWEAINRNNHWLDALALACVAGHGVGARIVEVVQQPPPSPAYVPQRESNWATGSDGSGSGWKIKSW